MKKQLVLSVIGIMVVVGGVAALSAWESHVINVTAHIENALKVIPPTGFSYGTVFPQEYKQKTISITTSESFCKPDQRRVLSIDYKITQKPKCINAAGQITSVDYATEECPADYTEMPSLCPFLSKTPKYIDEAPYTDHGVPAFHDPATAIATGTINKDHDILDEWIIDLATPCFKGQCSQDWADFVHKYNPSANPNDYILPAGQEGQNFGCDLWIEPTRIY